MQLCIPWQLSCKGWPSRAPLRDNRAWGHLELELPPDSSGIADGLRWPQAARMDSARLNLSVVFATVRTRGQPGLLSPLSPPADSGLERGEGKIGDRKFLLERGAMMLVKGASSRKHLSESKRNHSPTHSMFPQLCLCFPRHGERTGMFGRRRGVAKWKRTRDRIQWCIYLCF